MNDANAAGGHHNIMVALLLRSLENYLAVTIEGLQQYTRRNLEHQIKLVWLPSYQDSLR